MDPVRNPYAPGAGQRPPELAGRDREISQFEVVLERVARGRPERSMVLTGLRGVGKTVLLNTFRSMAMQRLWGTGKIEARPEQSIRRPVAGALHMAVRELAPRHRAPDRIEQFLGRAQGVRAPRPEGAEGQLVTLQLGIDVPAARGRADSGDLEIDLTELFTDAASVAADLSVGIALFIDEMQDVPAPDISALCAASHELSQNGGPLIVVGAGLPHLPSVLSASKSYSERLFRYVRIDRLDRAAADLALLAPAAAGGRDLRSGRSRRPVRGGRRLPVLRAGVRQGDLGRRDGQPGDGEGRAGRGARGRGGARGGVSSAAGTSGPPRPNASTCGPWPRSATTRCRPSAVADELGRKPSSLSPGP